MPEIDKLLRFNAFHILLIALIINIIINNNHEFIVNIIYEVFNMETLGFWFLMIHILIAIVLLINLKFELGFRAAIKFNL
jgi:hypothetical protein